MDVLNINSGQFRVDDMGNMYCNYMHIYGPGMIDNRIISMTQDIRGFSLQAFDKINILENKLKQSDDTIKALICILLEKSIIKNSEEVEQMIKEVINSKKVLDTLVEVGEENAKKQQ